MICGGYKLELRCNECGRDEVFRAETGTQARVNARRFGWKVQLSKNRAVCPTCVVAPPAEYTEPEA